MATDIKILEVGPRDGLQNEPELVSTEDKLSMVDRALAAGIRRMEVASFVHPKRVPQMADAEAVIEGLPDRDDATFIGLVLNKRGALRAFDTKIDQLGCVIVATDTFGQKNQGQTVEEGITATKEIIQLARTEGRSVQVTIAASFGCPFEGKVDPNRVVDIAKAVADTGIAEISLADTIGVAVPPQMTDLFGRLSEAVPGMPLRVHLHNTRNTGIANAFAAVQAGVTTLDASLGGIGGCPFAPKATGNIATEDLVYMLEQSGIKTGVDLDQLITDAQWLEGVLGKPTPAQVSKAGGFPQPEKVAQGEVA